MRIALLRALVVAVAFGVARGALAGGDAPVPAPRSDERADRAAELAAVSSACVKRVDTEHPAFHGCIDWHSAAHGVWSLVAASELTGEPHWLNEARAALDPALLAKEVRDLEADDDFENPYGRAWLLRLALDFERITGDTRLRPLADLCARTLAARFADRAVDPSSRDYESASWALLNLLLWADFRADQPLRSRVLARITEDFASFAGSCPALSRDRERPGFMPVCTNWAWIASRTLPREQLAPWLAEFLPAAALVPLETPATAHQYGTNFGRAWGLWNLAVATRDASYQASYERHLGVGLRQWREQKDDYGAVGHWVAQFGMLALHETLMKPMRGSEASGD